MESDVGRMMDNIRRTAAKVNIARDVADPAMPGVVEVRPEEEQARRSQTVSRATSGHVDVASLFNAPDPVEEPVYAAPEAAPVTPAAPAYAEPAYDEQAYAAPAAYEQPADEIVLPEQYATEVPSYAAPDVPLVNPISPAAYAAPAYEQPADEIVLPEEYAVEQQAYAAPAYEQPADEIVLPEGYAAEQQTYAASAYEQPADEIVLPQEYAVEQQAYAAPEPAPAESVAPAAPVYEQAAYMESPAEETAPPEAVSVEEPAFASAEEQPAFAEQQIVQSTAPAVVGHYVKFGLEPSLPYSIEEAINRLRINISFLGGDVKKIMIVSSEPNEGKSFVALNLWKQMAEAGEKSILLDLDMRKSTLYKKYHLKRDDGQPIEGTSHFLSSNDPIQDVILHTTMEYGDMLPNVDNIVNPSMLLESRKFTEMINYMEENYRYVFMDVPPLGLVSDGELIGSVCDGAVLCVRGGVTSRSIVRSSIQQLERAGCPVLGIVLNRVGGSGTGYYKKYYGKYYGKKYGSNYYNDTYYSGG